MARHREQQVSRSIGVLVPDLRSPSGADVVAGVTREARRRGYATILTGDPADEPADDPEGLRAAERFVALRVAGVVVVPVSRAVTASLTRRRTPVVEVEQHLGPGAADVVVVDDARLTHELTWHLLDLGHRRPALLVDGPAPTDREPPAGRVPRRAAGRRPGPGRRRRRRAAERFPADVGPRAPGRASRVRRTARGDLSPVQS